MYIINILFSRLHANILLNLYLKHIKKWLLFKAIESGRNIGEIEVKLKIKQIAIRYRGI